MQPQQPHGMYGYPPPVKQRRKASPAIVIAAVVGAVVLLCCGGITVVALFGGEPESDAGPGVAATRSADAPNYRQVAQKGGTITVEVDALMTEAQMKAIVVDVRSKQTEKRGYWVLINCSTGGTERVDNRLGNGRFGLGALGEAQTGLEDGEISVEVNEGRTCPAP